MTGRVDPAPQFPVLDTLRAVGAMGVLTTHVAFQAGAYTEHGVWGTLLARLDAGVALFFVLSGFLLARPWLARAALEARPPSTGRYYWKRVLRIWPVYLVTAVLALALVPENDGRSVAGWVSTLTLTDVYVQESLPHGLTQMWSLSAEVAFYVILPLLMALALGRAHRLRPARVVAVLLLMVAVGVAWTLQLGDEVAAWSSGAPATWVVGYLTWFACGIGLALLHVRHQQGKQDAAVRAVRTLGAMPGVCWTLVAGLMLVSATGLAGPTLLAVGTPGTDLTKHLLYAGVGALVVLTGVFADPAGSYARVMSLPALRHLGHISYSIFCIHLPLLSLVWAVSGYELFQGHTPQVWLLTTAFTLVASELLYRGVELPAMRLRNVRRSRGDRGSQAQSEPTTTATR